MSSVEEYNKTTLQTFEHVIVNGDTGSVMYSTAYVVVAGEHKPQQKVTPTFKRGDTFSYSDDWNKVK